MLSDYAFAFYLPHGPIAVCDDPMPADQLNRPVAVIFQAPPVSKNILVLFNIGLLLQEEAFYRNFDSLGVR